MIGDINDRKNGDIVFSYHFSYLVLILHISFVRNTEKSI